MERNRSSLKHMVDLSILKPDKKLISFGVIILYQSWTPLQLFSLFPLFSVGFLYWDNISSFVF